MDWKSGCRTRNIRSPQLQKCLPSRRQRTSLLRLTVSMPPKAGLASLRPPTPQLQLASLRQLPYRSAESLFRVDTTGTVDSLPFRSNSSYLRIMSFFQTLCWMRFSRGYTGSHSTFLMNRQRGKNIKSGSCLLTCLWQYMQLP